MKKQKKILVQIILFLIILLSNCAVFAADFGKLEISEEYLEYLQSSDGCTDNVIAPRMYDISKETMTVTNPLKLTRLLGSTITSKYSLRTIIPENMVIRNQAPLDTCWTFSSIAVLESHLGLQDYKSGKTATVYNFSERHMDYATSREFLDNKVNEFGFNRVAGTSGIAGIWKTYLTNGLGAISEEEMPYKTIANQIDISEIQNKNVISQVNDIIEFPSYSVTDDKTKIKQQMKEHIMNYGAIDAVVHSKSVFSGGCYNNETGAVYCNNITTYPADHAVAIIGWDDDYSIENFVEGNRPVNNGAWIIKNSWGTTIGDNGFWYVSYEDANIYRQLAGIANAQSEVNYENIYQYNEFGGYLKLAIEKPKVYLATIFDKQTTGKEYLTQISINATEQYTCKVYVNPNGTSKEMTDLQQVELKTGETETFGAGYHTIEFLKPIKINSDSFVVVLEIEGTESDSISLKLEANFGEFFTDSKYDNSSNHFYDNVTIANGKCFFATEDMISEQKWYDASTMYTTSNGSIPNFDTTIKAFTTSNVLENIKIETPPTKISYVEGQDFDSTGMIVKAYYGNETSKEITDYTIVDGESLKLGQTSITISYDGFTTIQPIDVVENVVQNLAITTQPDKTEYWAGDDFDSTGMVVEATYTDGTTKLITDYEITDSLNLKNDQTVVTISYEGKTITQSIIVKENSVVKLEIISDAIKVKYVVGQNFDSTGLVIKAIYANGTEKEVTDYKIQNGTNLQEGQTTVTIEYEDKTVKQSITVEIKSVISIKIKTMPTKTEYLQNIEELDLTGGFIEITYNDETKEDVLMTSEQITVSGFNNTELGVQSIKLTYQNKTIEFYIEILELPQPENSNFDNIEANVKNIRAYYYTNNSKKEYAVISINLNNIIKVSENDKMEYYYSLSLNPKEENILNWVKINNLNEFGNNLEFEINTLDVSNYDELADANIIYLYVKEAATRNDVTKEKTTLSLALEVENINIEKYIDDQKKADVNSGNITDSSTGDKTDNTLAPGVIPNAGKKILKIFLALVILIIGRIAYLKYKDIKLT